MIIESIRLKNIKSYAQGPDGNGVTISFARGVNRVAGRNGHGKTTLIESVGYALFLTEPQFEENFQVETYFLSHGAREGEMDVTFQCEGESYRIERTVGRQSKRRAKVIQLSDQSICAEGDEEVSTFLCRLLNFPNPRQLSELFCKLIGVKQGRLNWPFDSKPGEAKRYFEPLLHVEVFRTCFDRLRESADIFQAQRVEKQTKLAGIEERIRERANSAMTLANAREKLKAMTGTLKGADAAREAALKIKVEWEKAGRAVETAKAGFNSASQKADHAGKLMQGAELQVAESRSAAAVVKDNAEAHQQYEAAARALGQLEQAREQRDQLKQKRDQTESERIKLQAKTAAAREQAREFGNQVGAKTFEIEALQGKITPLKARLAESEGTFRKAAADIETAEEHRRAISGWVDGLEGATKGQKRMAETVARCAREMAAWDKTKLKSVEEAEGEARKKLQAAQDQLAKAEQRHATLAEQLKEISGGVCPFLKEKCRQFDPEKIKADLDSQSATMARLTAELGQLKSAHRQAEQKLKDLRTAHGRMTGTEAELANALSDYRDGIESLENVSEKIKWLLAWDQQLVCAPACVPAPDAKLDAEAVAALQSKLETFHREVNAWWAKCDQIVRARFRAFRDEEKARNAQETELSQLNGQLQRLSREIGTLAEKAAAKEAEATKGDQEAKSFSQLIEQRDQQLKAFASLDADLKREQQQRDAHRQGHELYLGKKQLADELAAREARLAQLKSEETAAAVGLQTAADALKMAESNFDPERLAAARTVHQAKHDEYTILKASVDGEQENVRREQKRVNEWQEACQERDRLSAEMGRCDAALEITELARKTLRDTAPAVAQHLCTRIAARAQGIFNQINPDPIELAWDAERYSLRVTPGDRRFAMLSGGEQTKLALAMTLSMIEEFSRLRFCVFDEPTYAVDADSRHKLVDVILQAQAAAGFEQLVLVSHDDAFEGKIEHSILLEKSAALGTRVANAQ